jgi:hypothetical protein
MDGLTTTVHCDVLKLLGMWRMGGKWPTLARIIKAGHRASGYGEPSSDRVRAYLGAKIFYSPRLSALRRARITATSANSSARSPAARCAAPEIFFRHYTIRTLIKAPDRAICRALMFDFYVTTHALVCINIVIQRTSYKFVIKTLLSYPLNSSMATDSHTLSPFYSKFCMSPRLSHLSKVIPLT